MLFKGDYSGKSDCREFPKECFMQNCWDHAWSDPKPWVIEFVQTSRVQIWTQHACIPIYTDKLSLLSRFFFFIINGTTLISGSLCQANCHNHPGIIYCILVDETKKDERKGFLDLLKIPGMIILFLICSVGQVSFEGRSTMMGVWAVQKVNVILLVPGSYHTS